jgi:hypothetical protein
MNECEDVDSGGLEALMVTVDDFGVPSNTLGSHPEPFFQVLGRTVALAVGLESNVRSFSERLADVATGSFTGCSFGQVVKVARKNMDRLASDDRKLAGDFQSRAEASILKRHTNAHSLWPARTDGAMYGWKLSRKNVSSRADETSQSLDRMQDDLTELVALCKVPYRHRLFNLVSGASFSADQDARQ